MEIKSVPVLSYLVDRLPTIPKDIGACFMVGPVPSLFRLSCEVPFLQYESELT